MKDLNITKAFSSLLLCLLLLSPAGVARAGEAGVDMDCYNRCMSYIINSSECRRRCSPQPRPDLGERRHRAPASSFHYVSWVIDADILALRGGIRLRLIGVAPPAPGRRFGRDARAFTRRMVEGRMVRLEYDAQWKPEPGSVWAYVYLVDGSLLNAELIKRGYGRVNTEDTFRYLNEFKAYEDNARESKRGLWGNDVP